VKVSLRIHSGKTHAVFCAALESTNYKDLTFVSIKCNLLFVIHKELSWRQSFSWLKERFASDVGSDI